MTEKLTKTAKEIAIKDTLLDTQSCVCSTSTASTETIDETGRIPIEPFRIKWKKELIILTLNDIFDCNDLLDFTYENIESKLLNETSPPNQQLKKICFALLKDVFNLCHNWKMNNKKTLVSLELFYFAFTFFMELYDSNVNKLIEFFQELLLLHSVDHPPKSLHIFQINEAYALLQLFEKTFLVHIKLFRAVTWDYAILLYPVGKGKSSKLGKKKSVM